jgi:hypothetical protein
VQGAEADPEQLRLLHHVNVISHLAAVVSLSRGHDRLKTANEQLAALLAVMPPAARQRSADFLHSSAEGTEV